MNVPIKLYRYYNNRAGQVLRVAVLLRLNAAKIYIKQFSECLYDLIIDQWLKHYIPHKHI